MNSTNFLNQRITIHIDRPLGSHHPQHRFLYTVNYGYLPGVIAPDGEEQDAYVLGITEPLTEFTGVCIAVIHRRDDVEDKLVVVPEGVSLTDDEIREQTDFQEQFFDSLILR
jgi:inorganic pyrophosphatase